MKIFGVSIIRIKELFYLFMKNGYDITNDDQWKSIKRDYFHILKGELE